MHSEIKLVINVSFSGDNFIENLVYIKTCFFYPQHPLRTHISTCVAYDPPPMRRRVVKDKKQICDKRERTLGRESSRKKGITNNGLRKQFQTSHNIFFFTHLMRR